MVQPGVYGIKIVKPGFARLEQATTDIGSLDFFLQGVDDGLYRRIGIRAAVFDR